LVKLLLVGDEMNLRLHWAADLLELAVLHIDWVAEISKLHVEVLILVAQGIHRRHVLLIGDSLVFSWNGTYAHLKI